MLRSRIIPCLLVRDKGLVKTIRFKDSKYVGDPINAVKIFNEKEVDELTVLDIDATAQNREPDFQMIKNLANESRMPLCYGGGVKTVEQAMKIISLGAEKIAISSLAVENTSIISDISEAVGTQSVVVIIDVKKKKLWGGYDIYTHNGTKKSKHDLVKFVKDLDKIGVGEIVINSIDNDGVMKGYDLSLMKSVRENTSMPLTALGGAGKIDDLGELVKEFKTIGAAAGSLFVFKGVYKAVLINYPNKEDKAKILA